MYVHVSRYSFHLPMLVAVPVAVVWFLLLFLLWWPAKLVWLGGRWLFLWARALAV